MFSTVDPFLQPVSVILPAYLIFDFTLNYWDNIHAPFSFFFFCLEHFYLYIFPQLLFQVSKVAGDKNLTVASLTFVDHKNHGRH